jgi:hypothetical protein
MDGDGDGKVDIDLAVTWRNNQNDVCQDPADETEFHPKQSSRCRLEPGLDIDVDVEPPVLIEVVKQAVPSVVDTSPAEVEYRVVVLNNSAASDPITVTDLADDIYGDLNGKGSCSVPQPVAPGALYLCSWPETVTGLEGDVITDTVTATVNDNEGSETSASDTATVTFEGVTVPTPSLEIQNAAVPQGIEEPGGGVDYIVSVQNTSEVDVTLDTLADGLYGDLNGQGNCSLPQDLPASTGIYICSHTQVVKGVPGDTIANLATASGIGGGLPVTASDPETVTIINVPSRVALDKSVQPQALPEPGGNVAVSVLVQNQSLVDTIEITQLDDSIQGNLNGVGSCSVPFTLAPAETYECQFNDNVVGNAGDEFSDTVFAVGQDDDGHPVQGDDGTYVLITDAPSSMSVEKVATPSTLPAPGGSVEFIVQVVNTSGVDEITLDSLLDDSYGDLTGEGTCGVPQTLSAGDTYGCAFSRVVSGSKGDVHTNTVTVAATDDDGVNLQESDSASVEITQGELSLNVAKTASPSDVAEPNGSVTYSVTVQNTSQIEMTLTSLVDDIYGDLSGKGSCVTPQTGFGPNDSYTCTFSETVTGNAGDTITDTVAATGDAGPDGSTTGFDSATVTITDLPSSMNLKKTANPSTLPAPGGAVTFSVVVNNTSEADAITLNSLVDEVNGSTSSLHGQGTCAVPQTIAVGQSYSCSFGRNVTGSNGDVVTDTVTAQAADDDGANLQASNSADVNIEAGELALTLTKSASPSNVPEKGGTVTYSVSVQNTSQIEMAITSLLDNLYGNLNGQGSCVTPQPGLGAGNTYTCSFTKEVTGDPGDVITDTITATGDAGVDGTTTASDSASVTITDVPSSITVHKVALPSSVKAPGGPVLFGVQVVNTSESDDITLNSITDDTYTDLGTCATPQNLSPGQKYNCVFTQDVTGSKGDVHTNTITVTATDDDGVALQDSDSASVEVTQGELGLTVTKTASPGKVPEPGGPVTYTIVVTNTGQIEMTLKSLLDDLYGDLNGQGNCSVPPVQVFKTGAGYTCSFTKEVSGSAGDIITDTVTATGDAGQDGTTTATDSASVEIADVPSSLNVVKVTDPKSVVEPGGAVKFSVTVENTSQVDEVVLESLVDNVHGDLNGKGTCSVPVTLQSAEAYSCSFTEGVTGLAGDNEIDTITARGTDDDGSSVSDYDSSEVKITESQPTLKVFKSPQPGEIAPPAGQVEFTVNVQNTSLSQPLHITSLEDNRFGDLNGQGSCSVPQFLDPGQGYSCQFKGTVRGLSPSAHVNVVTVVANRDDGSRTVPTDVNARFVSEQASAVVIVFGENPTIEAVPLISPANMALLVAMLSGTGYWLLRRRKLTE